MASLKFDLRTVLFTVAGLLIGAGVALAADVVQPGTWTPANTAIASLCFGIVGTIAGRAYDAGRFRETVNAHTKQLDTIVASLDKLSTSATLSDAHRTDPKAHTGITEIRRELCKEQRELCMGDFGEIKKGLKRLTSTIGNMRIVQAATSGAMGVQPTSDVIHRAKAWDDALRGAMPDEDEDDGGWIMNAWNSLDATTQTAIAAALAGIVAWALQRAATQYPAWTWLTPLSSKVKQLSVATAIPIITAAVTAAKTGDAKDAILALVVAFSAGQAAHNVTKPSPSP